MTRRITALALIGLVFIAVFGFWGGRGSRTHELLREVYAPTFPPVPSRAPIADALASVRADLSAPVGQRFIARLVPDQAGALWIMLLVISVVAVDFSRVRASRNLDLLLAFALAAMFFDVLAFARMRLTPESLTRLDAVFTAVAALNTALIMRAVWQAWAPNAVRNWQPNLRGRPLAATALLLLACNIATVLVREPDDAGYFTNLGAQRLRERGRLPYGDPLLTGTPGAAYGPVLYAVHVPFQVLVDPSSPNATSPGKPLLGDAATYFLPSPLATKLTTLTLHLAGVLALWIAGLRLTGERDVGWALVALYCGSGFVLGVGGDREYIGGITFISHMGPTALTLLAFACLGSPVLAGVMLAVSTGAGFYPAFMLPAWAGFFWPDRTRCVRFVAGFALTAAVIGASTLALSRPANGRGLIGTILADTFGHHTDPQGYGRSPFGFWGQRGGIRQWMITPLVGDSGLTTPAYAMFFGLVAGSFFIARGRSAARLALLSGAIALAASTIKVHSTGTYVAWGYPFLLIGWFAVGAQHGRRG